MNTITRKTISSFFRNLQLDICEKVEATDQKSKFYEDSWQHAEGGGGHSRVIENGNIIEKGGVNFSEVFGKVSEIMSKNMPLKADLFYATGVSIVMHPNNPFVPIIHMNVRYFELTDETGTKLDSWFGGGIDLTPHYINADQAKFFHTELKKVCDKHNPTYRTKFKKWADDYFYIPHREETRGIGGIFFDQLSAMNEQDLNNHFSFVQDVGNSFASLYTEFMKEGSANSFTEKNKEWQYLRRGRYAEFNLVYDRGTRFGFESGGRTESILMSLPPMAAWKYNYQVKPDSLEFETLKFLKKGIEWAL